ncbi:MAG: mannose-1-phosphate guanylyltransferase, partial [Butyrivibrio sp.]|nr:mannose-1-phosphate guanylyltransferase [Butyrivibrio sp.]
MNIVLLSGGSGKRLWPLSNDVRSKQFIKIFHSENDSNNELESMVQRVYSQIKKIDSDANITIATSKTQVSSIHNQLGDKVSVCVEPTRRDTFPAIALAASYLSDKLGVDRDDAVVICPVDPYVDDSYFECFKELDKMVKSGDYNLNLMGVEPTYPSEKYGYIQPETKEHISKVSAFKEKPDVETAQKYID